MGKPRPYPILNEKQVGLFWSKVDRTSTPTGCWLWHEKSRSGAGRGLLRVNKQMLAAPRVSFELAFGPCQPDQYVYQTCLDNACVAPHHLRAGTQGDAQSYAWRAEHGTPQDRKLAQRAASPVTTAKPYPILTGSDLGRFWSYVKKAGPDECWLWTGAVSKTKCGDYGVLRVAGGTYRAHRLAFVLAHGMAMPGDAIRHTCDVTLCANVKHLLAGTAIDNAMDRCERNRSNTAVGSRVHTAKLTEADIPVIRARLAAGELLTPIAADYGVHFTTIGEIGLGRAWTHVPTPPPTTPPTPPAEPVAGRALPSW